MTQHEWQALTPDGAPYPLVATCIHCGMLRLIVTTGQQHFFVPWSEPFLDCHSTCKPATAEELKALWPVAPPLGR